MYKETKRAAAVLGGLVLVAGGFAVANTAINSPASAASCYGGAKSFYKVKNTTVYPTGGSSYLKTSSRCKDINVKMGNYGGYVKVCFYPSSGSGAQCQKNYKWAAKGSWKAIATNVKDNTKFRLVFTERANVRWGYYAS